MLYGYDIHAPGILSADFEKDIPQAEQRLALYIPEGAAATLSKDKGNWHSDPQTYYIGEAFVPMLIESFQHGFSEFLLFETLPSPALMRRYGVPYLAVSEVTDFKNRKNIKGQGLDLYTETTLFDQNLKLISRFETRGTSEARGVFAKKGGPEVNLNAAIESNLRNVILTIQDEVERD